MEEKTAEFSKNKTKHSSNITKNISSFYAYLIKIIKDLTVERHELKHEFKVDVCTIILKDLLLSKKV